MPKRCKFVASGVESSPNIQFCNELEMFRQSQKLTIMQMAKMWMESGIVIHSCASLGAATQMLRKIIIGTKVPMTNEIHRIRSWMCQYQIKNAVQVAAINNNISFIVKIKNTNSNKIRLRKALQGFHYEELIK